MVAPPSRDAAAPRPAPRQWFRARHAPTQRRPCLPTTLPAATDRPGSRRGRRRVPPERPFPVGRSLSWKSYAVTRSGPSSSVPRLTCSTTSTAKRRGTLLDPGSRISIACSSRVRVPGGPRTVRSWVPPRNCPRPDTALGEPWESQWAPARAAVPPRVSPRAWPLPRREQTSPVRRWPRPTRGSR